MSSRQRRVLSGVARFAVAGALLWLLATSGRVEWEVLARLRTQLGVALIALALVCAVFLLLSWRACLLLRARGLRLSLHDSTALSLITNLFALVLPGGSGDLARVYYSTRNAPGRRTEIATVLILERVMGLLALTLFPLLAAPLCLPLLARSPLLQTLLVAAGATSALITLAIAVAMSGRARALPAVQLLLRKLPLRGYLGLMLDTLHGFRRRVDALAVAVGISALAHALSMGVVVLLVRAMQPIQDVVAVPFLASLGFVANNIPITPGGLGVGEAAFESLFSVAGLEGGAEALIAWRVLLLALTPLGAWLYLRGQASVRVLATESAGRTAG
ncbi:MAG: lysylphosphatidylglycerol synthase transmembrane domain-containing protein [Gemmatimonadaceae bacterium]